VNEDFVHITELLVMRIIKNCCDRLSEDESRRKQASLHPFCLNTQFLCNSRRFSLLEGVKTYLSDSRRTNKHQH